MLPVTRKELSSKLKEYFRIKYRGAAGFRVSSVKEVLSTSEVAMFSFNLKCRYKKEPYDLHFYIRFYFTNDSLEKAQEDFAALKKYEKLKFTVPKIPLARYVEGINDYFDFPFLIIEYYPTISLIALLENPTIAEVKELKDLLFRLDLIQDNELMPKNVER